MERTNPPQTLYLFREGEKEMPSRMERQERVKSVGLPIIDLPPDLSEDDTAESSRVSVVQHWKQAASRAANKHKRRSRDLGVVVSPGPSPNRSGSGELYALMRDASLEEELEIKVGEAWASTRTLLNRFGIERAKKERLKDSLLRERREHVAMIQRLREEHSTAMSVARAELIRCARRLEDTVSRTHQLQAAFSEAERQHELERVEATMCTRELERKLSERNQQCAHLQRTAVNLRSEVLELQDLRTSLQQERDRSEKEKKVIEDQLTQSEKRSEHYQLLLEMTLNRVRILEKAKDPKSYSLAGSSGITTPIREGSPSRDVLQHSGSLSMGEAGFNENHQGMRAIDELYHSLASIQAKKLNRHHKNSIQSDLPWSVNHVEHTNLAMSHSTPDLLSLAKMTPIHIPIKSVNSIDNLDEVANKSICSSWESLHNFPDERATALTLEQGQHSLPNRHQAQKPKDVEKKSRLHRLFHKSHTVDEQPSRSRPSLVELGRSFTDIPSGDTGSMHSGHSSLSTAPSSEPLGSTKVEHPESPRSPKKQRYKEVFKLLGLQERKNRKKKLDAVREKLEKD